MTVVAFKDGILAADSCWSSGNTVVSLNKKVFRLQNGWLYGSAGDNDDRELLMFFENYPGTFPTRHSLDQMDCSIDALVVRPEGDVWHINTSKKDRGLYQVKFKFAAVGSAEDIARGAMAFGATAYQAAKIACDLDINCRPPIDVVNFSTPIPKRKK